MVIAALYGGVALSGEWKPKLGLDLQGGTRITLEASTATGEKPTAAKLEEARGIIDQRVNGTGVAEAEVAVQGGRNIVVEIPGQNRKTSSTRSSRPRSCASAWSPAVGSGHAAAARAVGRPPSAAPSASASPPASPSATAQGRSRPPSATPKGRARRARTTAVGAADTDSAAKRHRAPSAERQPARPPPPLGRRRQADPKGAPVDQPLQWMDNPGDEWLQKFAAFTCPTRARSRPRRSTTSRTSR